MINIVSTDELAKALRYSGNNDSFREWCVMMGIKPLPGRRGFYDLALVRRRLDEAQGLHTPQAAAGEAGGSLVAARRARRGEG